MKVTFLFILSLDTTVYKGCPATENGHKISRATD